MIVWTYFCGWKNNCIFGQESNFRCMPTTKKNKAILQNANYYIVMFDFDFEQYNLHITLWWLSCTHDGTLVMDFSLLHFLLKYLTVLRTCYIVLKNLVLNGKNPYFNFMSDIFYIFDSLLDLGYHSYGTHGIHQLLLVPNAIIF